MRRTKASLIYKRTKNLRVVRLLLGHTKLESTVRYLGIEVDDARMTQVFVACLMHVHDARRRWWAPAMPVWRAIKLLRFFADGTGRSLDVQNPRVPGGGKEGHLNGKMALGVVRAFARPRNLASP